MIQSTVTNCINERPNFNCTNLEACIVADRISGFGLKNILYRFKPVTVMSVLLLPKDGAPDIEPDCYGPEMFKREGMLFDLPMNHYFTIVQGKIKCLVNAGYLARHFYISEYAGYRELKRLLKHAEALPSNTNIAAETGPCSTN